MISYESSLIGDKALRIPCECIRFIIWMISFSAIPDKESRTSIRTVARDLARNSQGDYLCSLWILVCFWPLMIDEQKKEERIRKIVREEMAAHGQLGE